MCTLLAVLNAVSIAIETDSEARMAMHKLLDGTTDGVSELFPLLDVAYSGWIILELAINIASQRSQFVYGRTRWWNAFDTLMVVFVIVEFVSELLSLSFMKGLRVLRMGKLMQASRFVKYFHGIQKMLISLAGSFLTLFWAFFLLLIMMCLASIFMLHGVASYAEELSVRQDGGVTVSTDVHMLNDYYGNFGRVLLTLFKSISGGDWGELAEPISKASSVYLAAWVLYVGFTMFGLLNILTGIFVDNAIQAAQRDYDIAIQEQIDSDHELSDLIVKTFQQADGDRSGTITEREFNQLMKSPSITAHLRSVGVDVRDAVGLFEVVDADGSGVIDVVELVRGFNSVRRPARSVDTMALLDRKSVV